jgi:ABC-2 type transport system ATP-binding protein
MLTASHLRKEFTNVVAVDDISFSVKPGQVFGLIGPNGAGKSTTIKMVVDILQPDRGEILIDGSPFSNATRNSIGYLPEERGLYRKSKLGNVLTYFAGLRGVGPKEARSAAAKWLERFSLEDHVKRNVEELSKGNQQKVQFIISVMHNPRLLLLDELFSGLDPVNQVLMKDVLLEMKRSNKALIFSTHQMDQAEKLCDDLILINKGRIVLEGPPSAIKQRYGKNSLRVEFNGDGGFIGELEPVQRADVFQNYAEIELKENVETREIISQLMPRLDVSSFARIEPSLQSIFIDIVGMPGEKEEAPEPVMIKPRTAVKDPRVRKEFRSVLVSLITIGLMAFLFRNQDGAPTLIAILIAALGISIFRFIKVKKKVEKEMRDAGQKEVRS